MYLFDAQKYRLLQFQYFYIRMKCKLLFIFSFLTVQYSAAQYLFEGQLAEDTASKTVYLSVIDDYRRMNRVYMEQIFKKTVADSTGVFRFEGANLPGDNRIYRIHIDDCNDRGSEVNHIFGSCSDTKSIAFIAHNKDTLFFAKTFEDQILCDISSTNSSSDALLKINTLKEEMIFDFADFRSEANRKLNSKTWFKRLQKFGLDTLSEQYSNEIAIDKEIRLFKKTSGFDWKWFLAALLLVSLLLNLLLWRQKTT